MNSLSNRLFYSAGGAVYAIKEAAYNFFILLYYTQVLGLSGSLTGSIIASSLIWDAISDPLIGTWSDRVRSRFGRRFPFLVLSVIPMGVGFIGLFSPPGAVVANSFALGSWLLFWSLWVRTSITAWAIPHLALSTELSEDPQERSRLLGGRMAVMFLFAVLLPAGALVLLFNESGGQDGRFLRENYPSYGLASALICCAMASISVLGLKQFARPDPDQANRPMAGSSVLAVLEDFVRTIKNRSFRFLIGYDMAVMMGYGSVVTLNLLIWTYYWQFDAAQISIILSVPSLLAVVALLLSLDALGRRFEKQRLLELAAIGLMLNSVWLYPAHLSGWLPESQSLMFWLNFLLMLLFMYCFLVRAIFTQSLTADITDEHAWEHGVKQEGGFFAASNFTQKVATVFGPFYGGIALELVGLEQNALPGTVPESVLIDLIYALGLGFIPAILVAWWFAKRINFDTTRLEKIKAGKLPPMRSPL
ncbi:MAG: MFS transporter [Pseudomonadota bacterium]